MFERFTDEARSVVVRAQEEARGLGHGYIGTEHLLLGTLGGEGIAGEVLAGAGVTPEVVRGRIVRIVGRGPSLATTDEAAALRSIGIDIDHVRARIEERFGPGALERSPSRASPRRRRRRRRNRLRCGPGVSSFSIPFTPRAKKVLELSLREALRLKHDYIGTEHILLGLLREGEGLAAEILVDASGSLDDLKQRVLARLGKAA